MKYIEHLVIYSIKYPFAKDNMDAVIIFLVNKYKYLLKNMINSIPVSVDKSTMNFKGKPYEHIIDMIKIGANSFAIGSMITFKDYNIFKIKQHLFNKGYKVRF